MAQNTSHAVMQQRSEARDSRDDFPTPAWATRALCERLVPDEYGPMLMRASTVWEPACGRGHMATALKEYWGKVVATDAYDYGFAGVADFFAQNTPGFLGTPFDWIITNPPFRLADTFALRALKLARHGVAIFARTSFLEGNKRYAGLFSKQPPTRVLQFVERVPIFRGRLDRNGSTATSYCWIVWDKANIGFGTSFEWIPPCRKRLEREGDYD